MQTDALAGLQASANDVDLEKTLERVSLQVSATGYFLESATGQIDKVDAGQ